MSDTTSTSSPDWTSGLAAALTDPGVNALLGAAQGFAQAAMPTRMPTPWGAVLGMGAGGALQGAQQGQKMQLEQQQIQQARMANQVAQSALPMALAKNQMLTNMWQHPDQIQQMINGGSTPTPLGAPAVLPTAPTTPSGATVAGSRAPAGGIGPSAPNSPGGATKAPDIGSATTAALGSLPDDQTRSMAVNAMLRAKLPQQAWAPWISSIQNESKWNLKAPDGSAGEIGPGQVKPDTGKMVGFTPDQLRDPQTNLVASAKYFGNQWQAGGGDPAAAMTGYNTGTPTGSAPGYVSQGMIRLGQWGYPGAPQSGASATGGITPQNAMALADQTEQQANDLERRQANAKFFQAQGMPPFPGSPAEAPYGDPAALRQKAADLRRFAFAGPTAAAQSQANLPAELAKSGFQMGQNGQMVPIPGGPGDPAYVGAKAAAEATATAGAKLAAAKLTPYDLRPGGMHVDPGAGTIVKNPELREVTDPNIGQTGYVHINPASPFAPPGTPGESSPVLAANGSPAVAKLAPDVQEGRDELTKGLFGKDTDSFVAANNTQGWLNQINHAAQVMNQAGPLYQTGPYADTRLHLMANVNDLARTAGVMTPFDENVMASPEELRKATTTAGFELSSHYEGHARQAAATIMNATSAVPGMSNSPQGITLVSNGINEGAQSAIDMHNYKMARFGGQDPYGIAPTSKGTSGGAGLETAEADYVKAFPASMYSNRAISTVQPFKITAQDQPGAMKQMSQYLPGTIVTLPNGNRTMVPPRPGAPPIPTYMHGYLQQGAPNATTP